MTMNGGDIRVSYRIPTGNHVRSFWAELHNVGVFIPPAYGFTITYSRSATRMARLSETEHATS